MQMWDVIQLKHSFVLATGMVITILVLSHFAPTSLDEIIQREQYWYKLFYVMSFHHTYKLWVNIFGHRRWTTTLNKVQKHNTGYILCTKASLFFEQVAWKVHICESVHVTMLLIRCYSLGHQGSPQSTNLSSPGRLDDQMGCPSVSSQLQPGSKHEWWMCMQMCLHEL